MIRAQAIRETAPHVVIALALCVGGWMTLVQPKVEALGEISRTQADEAVRLTPEQQWQLVQRLEEAQDWLREVQALNELSRDSNLLFSTIMQRAEDHGVQVVTVQPGHAAKPTNRSRNRSDEHSTLAVSQLEIVVRGRYERVASFIDSMAQQSPFLRPHSLQIAPVSDGPPPTISARFLCELLIFTPPPVLSPLKGNSDAP